MDLFVNHFLITEMKEFEFDYWRRIGGVTHLHIDTCKSICAGPGD